MKIVFLPGIGEGEESLGPDLPEGDVLGLVLQALLDGAEVLPVAVESQDPEVGIAERNQGLDLQRLIETGEQNFFFTGEQNFFLHVSKISFYK